MKTLFLSDLHLGSPLFTKKAAVVDLILSPEFEELILVGDIFDTWEAKIEKIFNDNQAFMSTVFEASKHIPTTFIMGNHDPDADIIKANWPFVGVHEEFQWNGGMITHGHQFDDLITKYSWLAKFLFTIHWICQRIFFINIKAFVRRILYSVAGHRQKKYYTELTLDIERGAVEKYKEYAFVVMGHTHLPKKAVSGATKYINCGDWIHNQTYVIHDSESKEFTLNHL